LWKKKSHEKKPVRAFDFQVTSTILNKNDKNSTISGLGTVDVNESSQEPELKENQLVFSWKFHAKPNAGLATRAAISDREIKH
jgi:hypothetical protein